MSAKSRMKPRKVFTKKERVKTWSFGFTNIWLWKPEEYRFDGGDYVIFFWCFVIDRTFATCKYEFFDLRSGDGI